MTSKTNESLRICEIFSRLEKNQPNPQTELVYTTEFSLLVSVILSAQATDASVNAVMNTLRSEIDSPNKVVKLGEESLSSRIRSLNIYRNKAHYIVESAKRILASFHGQVPKNKEDLVSLPGVGPKTANVVLNVLKGDENIAVDTHVFRVSHRLGLASASTPNGVEQELYTAIPKKYWGRTNHWLVLHGRSICKARKPKCDQCILNDLCPGSAFPVQKSHSSRQSMEPSCGQLPTS